MNTTEIKRALEAALLCTPEPLPMPQLRKLFDDEYSADLLRPLLDEIVLDWAEQPVELVAVKSGWRFQSRPEYAVFINRLTPERAPKYSRAVMETLAIIAYRQPVTRGDIEEIRGVSVSSQIIKTLEERGWIDVVGHKEVPGRPALFATTNQFLDDMGLLSVNELPPIDEMGDGEAADFFNQQVAQDSADGGEAAVDPTDESSVDATDATEINAEEADDTLAAAPASGDVDEEVVDEGAVSEAADGTNESGDQAADPAVALQVVAAEAPQAEMVGVAEMPDAPETPEAPDAPGAPEVPETDEGSDEGSVGVELVDANQATEPESVFSEFSEDQVAVELPDIHFSADDDERPAPEESVTAVSSSDAVTKPVVADEPINAQDPALAPQVGFEMFSDDLADAVAPEVSEIEVAEAADHPVNSDEFAEQDIEPETLTNSMESK